MAKGDSKDTHFDCIFDQGLMDQLVADKKDDCNAGLLLLEATQCIREHGVYVMVTRRELNAKMKEYLVTVGASHAWYAMAV
jgi:hypothetical protein